MIIKMKELLLFVSSKKVDDALHKLGELGAVEIRNVKLPDSDSIRYTQEKISQIEKAKSIIEGYADVKIKKDSNWTVHPTEDPERIIKSVLLSGEFEQKAKQTLNELNAQLEWYQTWGEDLKLKDFEYLKRKGIFVKLYKADKAFLKNVPKDKDIVVLPGSGGKKCVALFTRDENDHLDLKEEAFPKLPLKVVETRIANKNRQLKEQEYYLADLVGKIPTLDEYLEEFENKLTFRNALHGMGGIADSISYLKGYIPVTQIADFEKAADENSWGFTLQEPENYDDVPTQIKNPKWVTIINPVLEFVGVVPGYKEVDISLWFLMAFSLFFAMLVGDAGYGAIFFLVAILAGKKLPTKMKVLTIVLSLATMAWGVMTGTYFGSKAIAEIPFFNNLIIPQMSFLRDDTTTFMMHLSFIIGAVHLTIAHLIKAVQYINSIRALGQLGWVSFVWGLFLVVESMVLNTNDLAKVAEWPIYLMDKGYTPYFFYVGAFLVGFFSKEDKNFFKSILFSLANLPLSLINGFSDVVSYVRLFAVGMATGIVAMSFNEMTLGGVEEFSVGVIFSCIALLLGHALNVILALMAVMVHGIRLNMLEFAGHLNIEFSGEEFKPFKLKSTNVH